MMVYDGISTNIYPLVIKHDVLENGPLKKVIFLARNLHLLWGFSSQPCLITRGYTSEEMVMFRYHQAENEIQ